MSKHYHFVLKDRDGGDAIAMVVSTTKPEFLPDPRTFKTVPYVRSFKHPVVLNNGRDVHATYHYDLITEAEFETLMAFEVAPLVEFDAVPVCWKPL